MKKKILLVDDHPGENYNFISALRDGGYDVDVTAYISTARIKLKQAGKYNLVVLDVMMPTLGEDFSNIDTEDGLKTGLVYYESELKNINIPVLFWSWNEGFKKDIEEKKWDKTDFIFKNCEVDHLLKGVECFCEKFNI
ncbi:hypothetical protein AGMMS49965_02720 [Bacteroidia bacterium]|nr:hypothetical protein AGMMS49965_02720 [Bacteroidia bacterium]